jgi:hypothetical protein
VFEYRQAREIHEAFARHRVRYLFIGKSDAVLLGFDRSPENGKAVAAALCDLGFELDVEGFPVCHVDDIIASKEAMHRQKDIESLPRLLSFRKYWVRRQ